MERFEIFAQFDLGDQDVVEVKEKMKTIATQNWGSGVGEITPSYIPQAGDRMLIFKKKEKTFSKFSRHN